MISEKFKKIEEHRVLDRNKVGSAVQRIGSCPFCGNFKINDSFKHKNNVHQYMAKYECGYSNHGGTVVAICNNSISLDIIYDIGTTKIED